jgi:predicted transcriptional regulator
MRSVATRIIGSLELAILECFWEGGPQTSGQILAALRLTRTIAATTVATTLVRLYEQGFLIRELLPDRKKPWVYTARYRSRSTLLAGIFEQLVTQVSADHGDRAEALGLLLGLTR